MVVDKFSLIKPSSDFISKHNDQLEARKWKKSYDCSIADRSLVVNEGCLDRLVDRTFST